MAEYQGYNSKKGLFFLKDKKAMIFRAKSTQDSLGIWKSKYYPIARSDLWCYTRQLSEQQIFNAAQYYQNETRMFVFNYREGVTATGTYVRYAGTWYEITRLDYPDDYKGGEMFVYVKEYTGIIKDSDVMPYSAN